MTTTTLTIHDQATPTMTTIIKDFATEEVLSRALMVVYGVMIAVSGVISPEYALKKLADAV